MRAEGWNRRAEERGGGGEKELGCHKLGEGAGVGIIASFYISEKGRQEYGRRLKTKAEKGITTDYIYT